MADDPCTPTTDPTRPRGHADLAGYLPGPSGLELTGLPDRSPLSRSVSSPFVARLRSVPRHMTRPPEAEFTRRPSLREAAAGCPPTADRDASPPSTAWPPFCVTSYAAPSATVPYALPGIIPMTAIQDLRRSRAPAKPVTRTPYVDERMAARSVADLDWVSVKACR